MSSKKDKYLESAQKFIIKGQLDRAIRDYEQVVALDPNDIRLRQKLAELLVRANRTIEAMGEYETIGKYYADNGFYLKAIAVYKQIQKLDPDDIKTSLILAGLNEKQGLTGNALAEYGRVFSHFEKSGKRTDALKVIESMIAIDPENLTTRLKFAETCFALGKKAPAYEDFSQIALLLKKRGDESAFRQVADRISYLFPEKNEFTLELLTTQINSGDAAAIQDLQELTKKDQTNLKAWRLLLNAYSSAGAREETKLALQKMARIFPDDLSVKEGLMQCSLDDGDLEGGLYLLKLHGAIFAENGGMQTLERIYHGFLDLAPHDVRLLQGLKQLYETVGNREKLAETIERLDSLNRLVDLPKEESPEMKESFPEDSTTPVEDWKEPLLEEAEEVPIDFSEEGTFVSLELPDIAGTEPFDVEQAAGAEADDDRVEKIESEYSTEIDLELEISEDELAHLAEIYSETAAESKASRYPEDASRLRALPGSHPPGGEFTSEQELFSAEERESFELEIDFPPGTGAQEAASRDGQDKYSPDGLFSAFKRGLDQQLDKGDTETRYNLGIAFMEMGLYDEAIAEFAAAAGDPRRWIDCITLQGVCSRDKGDYASAEEIFKNGISLAGVSLEQQLSIKYELALLYESAGRNDDAIVIYRQIEAEQNDFRDTNKKLARLQGSEDFYEVDLVELESEDLK